MEMLGRTAVTIDLRLTNDELLLLNNAINEACEFGESEFHTRLGVKREMALELLRQINILVRYSRSSRASPDST
ncbi:MAG TPA: hypothetical protein VNU97_01990 [Rhizomicrobium sp.]|jgi:hypothetical protein|nr:hypothetical protein [Rhizomicrobium sp.]